MHTPVVRVLIADDFEAWRTEIRTILEDNPALRVVGEAQTGLEVVQQAQMLKPDLLVLDIGLPILSGIEATRILAEVGLTAKILFVSENRHWEIAEEALRTGALGYVVKSDAGTDLLRAIDAILIGEQFVSASLRNRWAGAKDHKPRVPLPTRNISVRHDVAFYVDDEALEMGFSAAIEAALNLEDAVLLIATESHRRKIGQNLKKRHVDLDAVVRTERYVQLDVHAKLSEIMANDPPDLQQCGKLVGEILRNASGTKNGEPARIAVFGECAPTLLRQGDMEGAALLEHLWNEIPWTHSVNTLCGYIWSDFPGREVSPIFQRICAEHTGVEGRELGY